MIFTTQGIPPIIVHDFDELKTEIRQNSSSIENRRPAYKRELDMNNIQVNGEVSNSFISNEDKNTIDEIFREMQSNKNLYLQFSEDEKSKKMVIKIINDDTQEVVRQIPPEIALKIARIISEQGQLTNARI